MSDSAKLILVHEIQDKGRTLSKGYPRRQAGKENRY